MKTSSENNAISSLSVTQPVGSEQWSDGIAIIGMSARFPKSRNVQEFWQHLVDGDILIEDLDAEALRRSGVDDATLADSSYVRRGNVIEDADCFDTAFFGLSRREAEILDPQHRVFLECAWEALENAGRTGDGERVGVFAGAGMNTYILQLLGNPEALANAGGYQMMLGNDKDFLATRAAYKLNLRGPSVTVQTACSTSLAAVHLACSSLLKGECNMALAGGVSISFPQGVGYSYIPGMILSSDGYCRPFDAKAGGTVPGRGAGVVVLKRLSDALADRDSIVAVIRGSAWNNDGSGKVGYTAPSVDGQAEVIRAALTAAGASPEQLGYIETHGTATELGDAIEFSALEQVFGGNGRKQPLVLGAVKANMGHTDVAAGVAGLIKAALAVRSGIVPPTPNFSHPNPALGLEGSLFHVSSSAVNWNDEAERWAGVSSFGIGGTNVHVVLNAAPATASKEADPSQLRIFPVSAKSTTALTAASQQLSERLGSDESLSAAEVAATLQSGRRAFRFRRAVVAEKCADAASLLLKPAKKPEPGTNLEDDVVFMFPGQGQQFQGMATSLYRYDSEFRKIIDSGCDFLRDSAGLDLLSLLAGSEKAAENSEVLRDTHIAQPALVLVEYAIAQRLRSLGVQPTSMLGHSLGELTAACVAGVFSFEDGLRVAAERGRLMGKTAPGRMLAAMLPPEKLRSFLGEDTWLAAENGQKMSVASGTVEAIEKLESRLAENGVATVRLASKNAFHTPLMADAAKAFREVVASVTRHAPTIPWLSNVSGTWISAAEAQDPQYWAGQIVSPVRFTRCLAELAERRKLVIEAGPGEALIGIARHQLSTSVMVPTLGAENRRISDTAGFLQSVATAWECGASIHWEELDGSKSAGRVPLPTYPFERQRCWVEKSDAPSAGRLPSGTAEVSSSAAAMKLPEKQNDISTWFYAPYWQSTPPASLAMRAKAKTPECWVLLSGKEGLAESLVNALRKDGNTVIWITSGSRFEWQDGNATVPLSSAEGFATLWERIDAVGAQPGGVIYLPGPDSESNNVFDPVLQVLQSAGSRRRHLRRFEFITESLESVSGEPIVNPGAGEMQGFAQTIRVELECSSCRCIDVDASLDDDSTAQLLLDELSTLGKSYMVAYRRGARWQKGMTQVPLQQAAHVPFREGGVYAIVGGTGGIGYLLAKHLLLSSRARVAVIGLIPLPDRKEWESWIAQHGADNEISRKIQRILDLEATGGEVIYLTGDITDRASMQGVLQQVQVQLGPLNGVIHAAGFRGGARLISESIDAAHAIRKPKVEGSRVLADVLRGSNLDFLLFFSSISALLPSPTQGAYAAANAFQNSFAEYCRLVLKIPAIAIGFDAWREVGMMAEASLTEAAEEYLTWKRSCAMTNQEGLEVIYRVLGQWRGSEVLVSTADLGIQSLATSPDPEAESNIAVSPLPEADSSELAAIITIWKDLLGVDSVEPQDNFFSLGGHSLMGTMMIARIRELLGVTLSLRDIFEAQTPERLTELVRISLHKVPIIAEKADAEEEREVFEI